MRLVTRFGVCMLATACVALAQKTKNIDPKNAQQAAWVKLSSYANTTGVTTASELLRRGDELKAFRDQNPDAPQAHEAARIEALNVLQAIYQGDQSSGARGDDLATVVRADSGIPAEERLEIAALHDYADFCLKPGKNVQAAMNQRENVARALIKEFPDQTSVYWTFLYLADDADDGQAQKIAADLLKMPAEAAARAGAQRLLDRYALVGQDIGSLFDDHVLPKVTAPKGVTIVYTWSSGSEGSQIGQWLASVAPSQSVLIGINCDDDSAAARQYAASHMLGGSQLYSLQGASAKLKALLPRIGNDFVVIADGTGQIRTVSARVQLAEKLKAAAR